MQTTYLPLGGKEYDVEITKISKDGKKFGMKITTPDGIELAPETDREKMQEIANVLRDHHPEVIAQAKMFFSGRMTEEQKMALEIDAIMNGD